MSDGCCDVVYDFRLRLMAVHGQVARARVVAVLHGTRPHVGTLDTLRLRDGIITDEVTGSTFCRVSPPLPRASCGA